MRNGRVAATVLIVVMLVAGTVVSVSAAPLKAAMVMSGPINDGGWNTSAYEGLQQLKSKIGFDIAYSEEVAQADQVNTLRNYASKGYDIVFGHGFEYGEALKQVAAEFPKVKFYQIGGDVTGPNLGSGDFGLGELSYLTGKLCAKFTKTNKIGFVGAESIPTMLAEVNQLRDTIKQYNPGASFTVAYTGSWDDVVKGKEAGLAQIANGVDIIVAIGDACDTGVIQAAKEKGIYVIGWSGDLNSMAPNVVLTSGVQSVQDLVLIQGKMLKAGNWKPESKVWGIADGPEYLGKWSPVVPTALKKEILADEAAIKSGKLNKRVEMASN
jgi:basic membrane protein A